MDRYRGALSRFIPLTKIVEAFRNRVLFPFYHTVSDDSLTHVEHLYSVKTVEEFNEDLEFFLHHFTPVSIEDLYAHVYGGKYLPEYAFILTFDDGFREVHDIVAPILSKKGIPCTFFLSTDFLDNKGLFYRCKASLIIKRLKDPLNANHEISTRIEALLRERNVYHENSIRSILRIQYDEKHLLDEIGAIIDLDFPYFLKCEKPYLTKEQVEHLITMGFQIGAHSVDHPPFSTISLQEKIRQVSESINMLVRMFHITHRFFAFPFSDHKVPQSFFEELYKIIDLSFGTGGISENKIKTHFQRVPMEFMGLSAIRIIKYFFHQSKR